MLLKKLIKDLPKEKKKIRIKGLSDNSKKIKKGYVFFAIKGYKTNGEFFIDEAIKKGAIAIVCSKNCKFYNKKIPSIKTSNIRDMLSKSCSEFYKKKPNNIIAVTGTNGKTSVADLFYQILNLNNIPVASIGTLGIKYRGSKTKSDLTSPNTILLHQTLEKIKKKNIENVIIEASSHGLYQKRISHLNIKAGIFTNFSQDHLDFHKSMKAYLNAKLILFRNVMTNKKTIISDKSIKEFSLLKRISKNRKLRLIDIESVKEKIKKDKKIKYNQFQLKNLAMAVIAAKLCKLTENKIFKILHKIKDVNGRLEFVRKLPNNAKVYIDFAHTPDALLKSLQALKDKENGNVSIVFGCGGERDFKKRPLMGKIASLNCKKIYITDDNPRAENPENIRRQICKGINKHSYNIGNRTKAIKFAIKMADPNEIILVAGKGHETQQIYKNKIISISDKKIINGIKIKKQKKISSKHQNFIQNKKIIEEIKKNTKVEDFQGISIDTRTLKKGNLFLTIKGKNHDGVNFIAKALKKGAKFIASSKQIKKYKNRLLKVDNETKFLKDFAAKKRNKSLAKILAITGSAGKTSLKNLVKDLLQNYGETHSSPKSYNNHFGVPLSLSNLSTKHKYGVFEVGMSKAGEINKLSKLIRPHIAIITNVGEAHIENFKNLKDIAKAKGEIINNIEKGGTIILNRDDKYFRFFEKKGKLKHLKIVTFGTKKNADIYPISVLKKNNKNILITKIKNEIFKIEFKDINFYNVLSSLAVLNELNLNIKEVVPSYKNYEPSDGRGKIHNIRRYRKNFKLIDESYNANPLSVKNAIKNFDSIKKHNFKKYLLLGDMLELGKKSRLLHKDLSKVINSSDIDKVFVKGTKTLTTYKNIVKNKRGNIFHNEEDVDFTFNNIISNNDYLMIKGSNATGLNNISKKMIKGF